MAPRMRLMVAAVVIAAVVLPVPGSTASTAPTVGQLLEVSYCSGWNAAIYKLEIKMEFMRTQTGGGSWMDNTQKLLTLGPCPKLGSQ